MWSNLGPFLSELKACRPLHRLALIDVLSGTSFSSKMAHRTAEVWTFENSMFDFGNCRKVLGHKTIATGFSSKNHAQRWHWRPKLPTRTDRQCRLEKYSGLSREPFSNRMGGVLRGPWSYEALGPVQGWFPGQDNATQRKKLNNLMSAPLPDFFTK